MSSLNCCCNFNIPKRDTCPVQQYIGNNQSFFDTLINNNCNVPKTFEFADHHFYTEGELNNLKKIASENNLSLITTEKDFVRIPEEKRKGIECLKVEIKLPNIDKFMHKLVN